MYSGKSPRTKSTSANSSSKIMAGLLQTTLASGAKQPAYQRRPWHRGNRWRSAEIACANAVFSSQAGVNAVGGPVGWTGQPVRFGRGESECEPDPPRGLTAAQNAEHVVFAKVRCAETSHSSCP